MLYKGALFNNKKPDINRLLAYGFKENGEYTTALGDFELTVKISDIVDIKVIETATGEEYMPVYFEQADGKFVGKLKAEIEDILQDIAQKCFEQNIFKSEQALAIIKYIKEKYGADPEYLWEKFPNNAVFREQKSNKWYAALLTVKAEKLGFPKAGDIEVIDLKASPDEILKLVDGKNYLQGYHMNKKHWFTICLDGSVDIETIFRHIDNSYNTLN